MARERYRRRSQITDEFDTSLMYDDIEKIREIEEEKEKDENSKLSFAGMMALVAGIASIALVFLGTLLPGNLAGFLTSVLPVIGFGALGYGFYKTMKLAFRQKELLFPTLNVYRKRPKKAKTESAASEGARTRTRSRARSQSYGRSRTYSEARQSNRRPNTYQNVGRKVLRRSRTNRVFSGVAGGIAEYLNVSPSLIRFAFIVGLLPPFIPIPLFMYLLLSIALPADYNAPFRERGGSTRTS